MQKTKRVETWNVQGRRVGKIVVRNPNGTFDGATNYRQTSKVGQVRKSRR